MGKTKKGKKGAGHEYWSKRPGTKKNNNPGKDAKKLNAKLERLQGKKRLTYDDFFSTPEDSADILYDSIFDENDDY
jgi:hypothetical protein